MAQLALPGASFSFLSQGAIIQTFQVADRNIVLSFPTPEPYLQVPYYFGETIGRVANRIDRGLIRDLNGRSYQLPTNSNGQHHLHGGNVGWGHRAFSGPQRSVRNGKDSIRFTYVSPHNEEGYPGTVELRVWYTVHENDEHKSVLEIEYEAQLVGEECDETVVNITNHSYFNLSNNATIDGTEVSLITNKYLVANEEGIPTGEIGTFVGVDAGQTFKLGAVEPCIDNCFVVDGDEVKPPLDTRARELRTVVTAYHASTGIHLEVSSTESAFQFYTGDYVDVPASEHGPARPPRSGFCVEPGRFINAINMPKWRDQVVLRRGQTWGSKIAYKAWKE